MCLQYVNSLSNNCFAIVICFLIGCLFSQKVFRYFSSLSATMARRGGKRRGHKSNKKDDRDDPNKKQKSYKDVVRENLAFEKYYKAQGLIQGEQEWAQFMDSLRKSLPAAFRINGFCFGQSQALKNIVESEEFGNLTVKQQQNSDDEQQGESNIIPLPWYPNGLAYQMRLSRVEIRKCESLQKLHAFLVCESESGKISRQEAVSMIPPVVLDIKPNHRVLDLCAAPGSKTAQIIEFLHTDDFHSYEKNHAIEGDRTADNEINRKPTNGVVVANDVDNTRCYMLVHQSKRLNSPAFIITNHDAGNMPTFYENNSSGKRQPLKFDRIVCDVPCSGDGTIRKNIDVWSKWNVSNGNNFNGLQTRIAKRATELLAKDGLMVYSTCSFNPMENEAVVSNLLNESKGALELVEIGEKLHPLKFIPGLSKWVVMRKDLTAFESFDKVDEQLRTQIRPNMFPPENVEEFHMERCVRVLPHLQDTGGFFIALIRKKTDKMPWEVTKDEEEEEEEVVVASKTIENGTTNTEVKTDANSTSPPPNKKQKTSRRTHGFKEDPFYFMKDDDKEWKAIQEYYGISNDFPNTQLMHRTESINRNLYYLTEAAKSMIVHNENKIKFINAGVRMFSKVQDKAVTSCGYRITQEGLPILYPYLDKRKIVDVTRDEFGQILSAEESAQNENFSQETQTKLAELGSGCCVIQYREKVINNKGEEEEMLLPVSAWKGKASTRPYICKTERLHFLTLCKFDTSEYESEQQKKFQEKQQRRLVRQNQVHGEKQNESTENVEQLEDDDSEMQI